MILSFGYSFTTMDTDTDGSSRRTRPVAASEDFFDFSGGGEYQSQVVNANFWWNPIDDLVIVPSLRAEWEDLSGIPHSWRSLTERILLNPATWDDAVDQSDSEYDSLTEQLELRYTGIENILLYAKGVFNQVDGDVKYLEFVDGVRRWTEILNPAMSTSGRPPWVPTGIRFPA